MPVKVIYSKEPGPRLFVSAAIHGDEINGVEIIRRLLKILKPQKIRGALITVPVVNTHGFLSKRRYLPDRRDLNRSFPGSEKGSMAARIAYLFMQEVVSKCTHGIDLHTAAIHRINLPHIRVCLKDKKARAMAMAFNAPVILNSDLRDGSLRQEVLEKKIPMLLYEGGEALRFNEIAIRAGVNGILSVMQHLGMIVKNIKVKKSTPYVAQSSQWVRAPESGIFRSRKKLGSRVKKGDSLGVISDPFGKNEIKVISPLEGIVVGKTQIPLVDEGEALYNMATFKKIKSVEEEVIGFQNELSLNPIYLNNLD
ncbi:MAG: succinylglutamate desuccinylase/aspartoacylase family protein [Deltaproteobacteria bacterium]|nr:succinylglutamate desuccinylase/aspartoacylase family protein [Deltaproteobacteria bacterium]